MKPEKKIAEYKKWNQLKPREDKILDTIHKSKEIFCQKEQEKLLTYYEFLWIQFRVTQKKWWVLQAVLLAVMGAALPSVGEDYFIQRGLGIAGVLFVVLIIPELWKNQSCKCMEIEGASYYSLRQIYAARILLFGLVDVVMLTVFCLALRGSLHITLLSFISQFFFPMLVTACICFGLLCRRQLINEAVSVVLCVVWSTVWWLITANEKIYAVITPPVWIALTVMAAVILSSMIYRIVHDCMKYWEDTSYGIENS